MIKHYKFHPKVFSCRTKVHLKITKQIKSCPSSYQNNGISVGLGFKNVQKTGNRYEKVLICGSVTRIPGVRMVNL